MLDLGTGPGYLPIEILKRSSGIKIIGVDLSRRLIHMARDNARRAGLSDRLSFEFGNSSRLRFNDGEFDMVLSTGMLHSLKQPVRVFQEIYRVLKKGGIIRISTPDLELLMKTYLGKNPHVDVKDAIKRNEKLVKKNGITKAEWFNNKMRTWGHEFIYDFETLKKMLKECRFCQVKKHQFGKSKIKELQNLEKHADVEWMKKAEPLIVEAKKLNLYKK